jgi:hypothetical protein
MNSISDNVIPNIYDQEHYTKKEPINYTRTKTVISQFQINKKYIFFDSYIEKKTRSEITPENGVLNINDDIYVGTKKGKVYAINSDGTYEILYHQETHTYGVYILHNNLNVQIGVKLNLPYFITLENILKHEIFNNFSEKDFIYIIDTTCNSFLLGKDKQDNRIIRSKARFYDSFFDAIENDKKYGFDSKQRNSFVRRWYSTVEKELHIGGKKKKKTKRNTKRNKKRRL